MANICFTDFRVICDKDFVDKIEELFADDNGRFFHSERVSVVLDHLGVEPKEGYSLRGSWEVYNIEPYTDDKYLITLGEESAWAATQTMAWIAEKYDIKYFFYEEECGNDIFVTNDRDGVFFPYKWRVYIDDAEDEYFSSLDEAMEHINGTLQTDYKTIEDVEDDERVCLNEVEISDDL